VFLDKLNSRNIYLLFSMRNEDGKAVYYQPSWIDKEMLDFIKMRKQLHGHITILLEMDRYGEQFPEKEGILLSPKELSIEIMRTLDKAQFSINAEVERKLKELIPPEEFRGDRV